MVSKKIDLLNKQLNNPASNIPTTETTKQSKTFEDFKTLKEVAENERSRAEGILSELQGRKKTVQTPTDVVKKKTADDLVKEYDKKMKLEGETIQAARERLRGMNCIYHLTHVDNLPSILKHGILSKNEVGNLLVKDLSWKEPQNIRSNKDVRISNFSMRKLHDLVPFYFTINTPNNYRMWEKDHDVCILCVSKKVFSDSKYAFAISDGNMASHSNTYDGIVGLAHVNWRIVYATRVDYSDSEAKRLRMAESLIYPKVSPKEIVKIITSGKWIKEKVLNMVKSENMNIPVYSDHELFI